MEKFVLFEDFVCYICRYYSDVVMESFDILNIKELLEEKDGLSYKGELAVFSTELGVRFRLRQGKPIYVNAFSYVLVLSGTARLSVDEVGYAVKACDLCVLTPLHLTFFSQMSDSFRCLILCVEKRFVDRMNTMDIQHRIVRGMNLHLSPVIGLEASDAEVVRQCMENLRRQLGRTSHRYYLEILQNALTGFYLEVDNVLDRYVTDESTAGGVRQHYAAVLQRFISLLMENYREKHTVGFYAERMHYTPQYLTEIVKRQTGRTVNDFIFEMLYCEARNLLNVSDASVQQIAEELNFSDQAAFSKFFKRRSGMSPLEFRKINKAKTAGE